VALPLYNGEIRSPSTALSPLNKRRCGHILISLQYHRPAGFVLVGGKVIHNNNNNSVLY